MHLWQRLAFSLILLSGLLLLAVELRGAASSSAPLLYTIDLPDTLSYDPLAEAGSFDSLFVAEHWLQSALNEGAVKSLTTSDAARASLFYFPLLHVRDAFNGPPDWLRISAALGSAVLHDALSQNWSLERTVLFLTGDFGACGWKEEHYGTLFSTALFVTHFGLHTDMHNASCHAPSPVNWVVAPAPAYGAVEALARARAARASNATRGLFFTYYGPPHGNGEAARAALITHWAGKPGYSVGATREQIDGLESADDVLNSTFCGCPHGAGWGSRLSDAVLRGCIPVIVQDNSTLPLEQLLDYSGFSVRLSTAEVPRLDEILRAVSADRLVAMQTRLAQVAPYFLWDHREGGRAAEATLRAVAAAARARGVIPAGHSPPL
jgi:Exostosin family